MDITSNPLKFGLYTVAPAAGLGIALAGTYRSYTPTTNQNLLIGSLTLLVIHLYANAGLSGFDLRRTLGADIFTLFGFKISSVQVVSTVVVSLALAMQVAYIERTRALPAVWRQRKD